MRHARRFGAAIAVVALLALPGAVMAAPAKDIVNGSIGWDGQQVTMNAQSDTDGSNARGSWAWSGPGFSFTGTVTALDVRGDAATACGPLDGYPGVDFVQWVTDAGNGAPHGQGDTSYTTFQSSSVVCPVPVAGAGVLDTSGNWHVFDADQQP